jgi:pimeloyl-ACP methyl ester carboxylesterase
MGDGGRAGSASTSALVARCGPMAQNERWLRSLAREARAAPEFAAFVAVVAPLIASSPRGDGHPVLVLPGLGGGDTSTMPMRWFLDRLGYRTSGWGMGRNTGLSRRGSAELRDRIIALTDEHGRRVSLVGWSLGGVYATALARSAPHLVRGVITLGSPLSGRPPTPADIPTTSVYSRSDSIVPWRSSIISTGALRENVEVRGSHLGLGHNPPVLVVVADRLAQREGSWRPFVAQAWSRRWIPDPASFARAATHNPAGG